MRIFLTITVGISLIILAAGTIVYIENPTFGGGFGLAAAWAAIAIIAFFTLSFTFIPDFNNKGKRSTKNDNQSEELEKRVKELEKRLIDLQDIVITNDDKLERLESKPVTTLSSPPQTISE